MPQGIYLPEGHLLKTPENLAFTLKDEGVRKAWEQGRILEGIVTMCDEERNMYVRLGNRRGIITMQEAGLGADRGKLREIAILSRVGKPVCFRVIGETDGQWLLSRRQVQEEADRWFQKNLMPGEILQATVTHLEQFGAFVDIGCGLVSMIGIEHISISRIRHTDERFTVGQQILAMVLNKEPGGRICLTHRELLGTWQQNADRVRPGHAVKGIIRGIEKYGIFVELFPNLSGLAEPCIQAEIGKEVAVYIKSILPERMKIKLSILDILPEAGKRIIRDEDYYLREGRILRWQYQPNQCSRSCIETYFT